jgi:hypothetical protein
MVSDFAEVIDRLGGIREFGEGVGMSYGAAKKARRRNSLSPKYFAAAAALAEAKGLPITAETLAEIAAGR